MLTQVFTAALAGAALAAAVPASHFMRVEARQVEGPFALQTKVIPGIDDCGTNKNGLYVVSYHTGAGLGVAALATDEESFYRNETDSSVYFDYPTSAPWPIAVEYGPYQAYNALSISVSGDGPPAGLFFNSSGLQDNETYFGGWLACDSWYSYPQLFILNGPNNGPLPKSCSLVQLMQVPYVNSSSTSE